MGALLSALPRRASACTREEWQGLTDGASEGEEGKQQQRQQRQREHIRSQHPRHELEDVPIACGRHKIATGRVTGVTVTVPGAYGSADNTTSVSGREGLSPERTARGRGYEQ